ncbi:hypothetical protein JYT28_01345, partial [Desulfobulbus sp. AH-315-M07]|nr:hypothetical protein [Desulfobulbus sp. AH-315-M07]
RHPTGILVRQAWVVDLTRKQAERLEFPVAAHVVDGPRWVLGSTAARVKEQGEIVFEVEAGQSVPGGLGGKTE